MHRRITRMHSDAARRRIVDPIHAASEKGLGDNLYSPSRPPQASRVIGCDGWVIAGGHR